MSEDIFVDIHNSAVLVAKLLPLYINFEPRMSILSLKENAKRLKKEKGIRCLFVETIQSVYDDKGQGCAKEETHEVCRELKNLARELEIPIIVTSDLSRAPEHREGIEGKLPQLCDLLYSSSIECYADKVFLLYRPESDNIFKDEQGNDLRGIMTVVVAKNKNGSIGDFRLKVNPSKCLVANVDGSVRDREEQEHKFRQLLQENLTFQTLSNNLGLEFVEEKDDALF